MDRYGNEIKIGKKTERNSSKEKEITCDINQETFTVNPLKVFVAT